MDTLEFQGFPKIARLNRNVVITEKIDGTNAQIIVLPDGTIRAGSRSRFITQADDNYGFAKWVYENEEDLKTLGEGQHFGEWWGFGIQRNYSQPVKRFSLFNTERWGLERPKCCDVVPVLYKGVWNDWCVQACIGKLKSNGSVVSPGFRDPEGIVIWHEAARQMFKVTVKDDEAPKSLVA